MNLRWIFLKYTVVSCYNIRYSGLFCLFINLLSRLPLRQQDSSVAAVVTFDPIDASSIPGILE